MGLLDSSGGGRRLAGSLGGKLLPGGWRDKIVINEVKRFYLGALPPVDLRAVCLVRAMVVVVLLLLPMLEH